MRNALYAETDIRNGTKSKKNKYLDMEMPNDEVGLGYVCILVVGMIGLAFSFFYFGI